MSVDSFHREKDHRVGNSSVHADRKMGGVLRSFNKHGYKTVASCQGGRPGRDARKAGYGDTSFYVGVKGTRNNLGKLERKRPGAYRLEREEGNTFVKAPYTNTGFQRFGPYKRARLRHDLNSISKSMMAQQRQDIFRRR